MYVGISHAKQFQEVSERSELDLIRKIATLQI